MMNIQPTFSGVYRLIEDKTYRPSPYVEKDHAQMKEAFNQSEQWTPPEVDWGLSQLSKMSKHWDIINLLGVTSLKEATIGGKTYILTDDTFGNHLGAGFPEDGIIGPYQPSEEHVKNGINGSITLSKDLDGQAHGKIEYTA